VPTWKLGSDTKLAWGIAGLVREIDAPDALGLSSPQTAWDTDLTLTYKNWTFWGQYIDSHGTITPARYVSGGPSDRQNSVSAGINYKCGPISAHVNFSKEWDHSPDGHQFIFAPGFAFQLAKNLTLYTEYVKWNVTDAAGVKTKYDNGFELALVWNF
jgi:predicted porin